MFLLPGLTGEDGFRPADISLRCGGGDGRIYREGWPDWGELNFLEFKGLSTYHQ